jgi:hypothetical protein
MIYRRLINIHLNEFSRIKFKFLVTLVEKYAHTAYSVIRM